MRVCQRTTTTTSQGRRTVQLWIDLIGAQHHCISTESLLRMTIHGHQVLYVFELRALYNWLLMLINPVFIRLGVNIRWSGDVNRALRHGSRDDVMHITASMGQTILHRADLAAAEDIRLLFRRPARRLLLLIALVLRCALALLEDNRCLRFIWKCVMNTRNAWYRRQAYLMRRLLLLL